MTRLAPNASQKVLVEQLREMEEHGLLKRKIFRQVPPRVDYTATPLGLSLEPVIMSLCEWGRRHATALNELDRVAAPIQIQGSSRRASTDKESRERASPSLGQPLPKKAVICSPVPWPRRNPSESIP
jgi:HxlR-like helix-turn-helix